MDAQPNAAHYGLAELEKNFDVTIITQNIDDLHERAGSTNVLHLHGEIFKMRSEKNELFQYPIHDDIKLGDKAADGAQLRPHIVWFEEPVPAIEPAIEVVKGADIFIVVGTSLVVYPAAGLVDVVRSRGGRTWLVNAEPPANASAFDEVVLGPAGIELPRLFA